MPKVHKKKANKDYPEYGIKKGDTYYMWTLYKQRPRKSLTYPKASQLTASAFLSSIYDLNDQLSNIRQNVSSEDELQSEVETIKSELETLRDECETSRSNMPEHLQDVGTGEILQERYDAVEAMINEIDGIDLSFDDEADIDEWLDEKCEELSNIQFNG